MRQDPDYVGYLEYHGKLVDDGAMDARKAAKALLGFDSAIRHFAVSQNPSLKDTDYEIPVIIKKGSWRALIPVALGIITTGYLTSAASTIAKNDFKDVSLKQIFAKALKLIQWFIKIGKHVGTLERRKFTSVRWRNNNTEVGIPNDEGEYLYIPKAILDSYLNAPQNLISDIASLIEPERVLKIVVQTETGIDEEDIPADKKFIFSSDVDESEVLFPELKHNDSVALEGVLTRGNENTNSMGFRYREHILNCIPQEGSIVRYKHALFLKCRITGNISREDSYGKMSEKKPSILFTHIEPLENEQPPQPDLLPLEE